MLKTLLFIFLLLEFRECLNCTSGYEDVNGRGCFKAIKDNLLTWDYGQQFCQLNGGNLASINSCALLEDLIKYLYFDGLESSVGYWIGATDAKMEGKWQWIADNSSVPMGTPFWGTNNMDNKTWIPEPNGDTNENCAILSSSDQYYFHDKNCSKMANVLCQSDPIDSLDNKELLNQLHYSQIIKEQDDSSSCPDQFERISGSCFHFHFNTSDATMKKTWNDAYQVCRDMYGGSHLAVLSSCDLFKSVVDFISNNSKYQLSPGTSYWIGGTDQYQEDLFYWIDFTFMKRGAPFWGSTNGESEPSGGKVQNCVTLYRDDSYYFHDSECYLMAYPLCQTELISF